MALNTFLGEANGGRIVKLEVGTADISAIRGGNLEFADAEDDFTTVSQTDLNSWTPTESATRSPGMGGWTYNKAGATPTTNDMVVKSWDSIGMGNNTTGPCRSRNTVDLFDGNFEVRGTLGRTSVDATDCHVGLRVLVDGSANQNTEHTGVDIVFIRTSGTTMSLFIREFDASGVQQQSKQFYSDASQSDWTYGSNQFRAIKVVVTGDGTIGTTVQVYVGAIGSTYSGDPTYSDAGITFETVYNAAGAADNTLTTTQNYTGQKRIGAIVRGNPESGTGFIREIYANSIASSGEILEDVVGPDLLWRSKPYSPAGEGADHSFRRITFFIKHNAGFEILVIPYVDGDELFDEDGVSQRQTITETDTPDREVVDAVEIPIKGEGQNVSWTLITSDVPGNFYIEGVVIGYQSDRPYPGKAQGS